MSEWRRVKLEELYEVHNGLSKARSFFGSGYPFLSFSTVFNNWFLPESLDSLVQSTTKEREAFSIKRGDVFITRTSETPEELGMSSVALKDYPDATFNGFCKRLRQISDDIVPEFAGYVLRSHDFRSRFYGLAGNMTSRASLRNEDLLEMTISLPPLATQRRIASILFNYESAIANCRRQIALLEEAAMRLYKEWFKDEKGEKRKLVDVFSFERGCTITKTQVKRSRDDENRYTVYGAGKDVFGYYSKCNVCHRCVVVAAIGAGAGEVRRTLNEQSFVTSNSYIVTEKLRPMFSFMYQLLKSINFKGLNTGAAQPQISYNSISALDFMMPDSASIQRYCQIADKFVALEDQCYETIEKLTEARDRLLPKLMKGEIAV